MKKILQLTFLINTFLAAQENNTKVLNAEIEEVITKGNILYADQVNALKTPVPVLDVPQSVSIVTDEDIRKQGFREISDIVLLIQVQEFLMHLLDPNKERCPSRQLLQYLHLMRSHHFLVLP